MKIRGQHSGDNQHLSPEIQGEVEHTLITVVQSIGNLSCPTQSFVWMVEVMLRRRLPSKIQQIYILEGRSQKTRSPVVSGVKGELSSLFFNISPPRAKT